MKDPLDAVGVTLVLDDGVDRQIEHAEHCLADLSLDLFIAATLIPYR